MSRVRDVNERPSYPIADTESFDSEGYCLTASGTGDRLQKTQTVGDTFMGVNHKSSYDTEDETIESGGGPLPQRSSDGMGEMAVEQDGVVNMMVASGVNVNPGAPIYLSGTAGVANASNSGSDTQVGTAYKAIDTTDESSPTVVPVNITGYV